MSEENARIFEFGAYRLDVGEHTLTRLDGEKSRHLPDKAYQTLRILVEKSGQLFSKQELIEQIWPDSFVEENNLDKCIHAIRQVLGETATEQKYIQTVRKHGYRFVAEVKRVPANGTGNGFHPDLAAAIESSIATQAMTPQRVAATGNPLKRNKFAIAPIVGIAILGLAIAMIGSYISMRQGAPAQPTSIAVLPLKPVNLANRNSFHEGGITDSLILRLGATKGLMVRPLDAIRKYVDVGQDPLAAGREEMVDYVLASNYQLAGGRIQITAQLFDVKTGAVVETFKIEKEANESFAVQDAIAREVGEVVAARFGRDPGSLITKRGTANENAYTYYLNATNLMARSSLPVAEQSVEYLEEAVRLDPGFARAYAALGRSRVELSNLVDDPESDCEKARIAFERSFALDAALADAYESSGLRKQRCEWNFAGAGSDLLRAVELDQNSDSAHAAYGHYLNTIGRFDDAIAETETAISLNPNSLVYHKQLGVILQFAGRYERSITTLNNAKKLGQLGPAHGWLWTSYFENGQETEAFQSFLKYQTEKQLKPDLAKIEQLNGIYAERGWKGIWERQMETEIASPIYTKGRFYRLSRFAVLLGNIDDAFLYLNMAIERRDAQLLLFKFEPAFDPLRSDPRYPELLQRIGFPSDS